MTHDQFASTRTKPFALNPPETVHETRYRRKISVLTDQVEALDKLGESIERSSKPTVLSLPTLGPYEREQETTLVRANFNKTKYFTDLLHVGNEKAIKNALGTVREDEDFMEKYHIVKPNFEFLRFTDPFKREV